MFTPPLSSRLSTTGEGPGVGACPVCWLLAADEHPGEERRGYALVPPPNPPPSSKSMTTGEGLYQPGQRFTFGLTLFGSAQRYLPYFILAVPEMGRLGLGPGRGQFALRSVIARDPLEGHDQIVLAEGEALVRVPDQLITPERIIRHCERLFAKQSPASDGCHASDRCHSERSEESLARPTAPPVCARDSSSHALSAERGRAWRKHAPRNDTPDRLRLNFLTPLRLIDDQRLVKAPDFGVLFKRLLERLDELNVQYSGGTPRPSDDVQALQTLANQVRLIESQTQWIELQSGSRRTGRATPISGFIGSATYTAPSDVWRALLPWLVWGTITQVGKDVVKGNGVFEVGMRDEG